jgi:hypothetical protein
VPTRTTRPACACRRRRAVLSFPWAHCAGERGICAPPLLPPCCLCVLPRRLRFTASDSPPMPIHPLSVHPSVRPVRPDPPQWRWRKAGQSQRGGHTHSWRRRGDNTCATFRSARSPLVGSHPPRGVGGHVAPLLRLRHADTGAHCRAPFAVVNHKRTARLCHPLLAAAPLNPHAGRPHACCCPRGPNPPRPSAVRPSAAGAHTPRRCR